MVGGGLDINANRSAKKYSLKELILRILWGLVFPLYRFSPRPMFAWRASILRIFGAKVGQHTNIYNTAIIYMPWNLVIGDHSSIGEWALIYNIGSISIGSSTTISQRSHLCAGTHDFNDPALPLLKPPIVVGNQAWICADSFVGPNITVGEGAIVGARAVVTKNVGSWSIVAGNPAKYIKMRNLKNDQS